MAELLRHPGIMKEMQDEMRGIIGSRPNITEEDIEQMHYLKMVIKETLRLHPPIPLLIPRESTQDVKIQGYDIPTKTRVIINSWAIMRDPLSWERAEEFHPKRFMNAAGSSIDFRGHDFQMIPFGAGRRGCPGKEFAAAINELVLANLLHKFDWTLPNRASGKDLDMEEDSGITIHKKSPLLVATPHYCYHE
nr:TPA_asm: hypothetical protein HUJ06_030139 [Nelumbo nucifera]